MTRLFIIFILILSPIISLADVMRVTILGSGTPRPDIERFSQAILIEAGEDKLLFDTGRGTSIRLSQMDFNIGKVDKIFFTHLHSDHIVGFPDVLMTGWVYQRNKELKIFGPPGTKHFVKKIYEAFSEDIVIRTSKPEELKIEGMRLNVNEIESGLVYKNKDVSVNVFEVDHGGGVEHSLGYKISYKGRTVIISGDTNYSENLVNNANKDPHIRSIPPSRHRSSFYIFKIQYMRDCWKHKRTKPSLSSSSVPKWIQIGTHG